MDGLSQGLVTALEGRYHLERELGEGGMARVFLAHDLRHERRVALKLLRPELAAAAGAERFLAEIRTTANLQHPHILPLFDSGTADGFVFYVMPYVDGESLAQRLEREGQLSVEDAVRITQRVAEALDYAHEQGVIHRDVKPANILLSRGRPLVADFGIALAVEQARGARLTETGVSLGTPQYMSPEQATGERVDSRSDVYALGCVLYEMLAGEPPHGGRADNPRAVLASILTAEPRRVREVRRSVPRNVDGAVARALEKLPADRFSSAGDLARALQDAAYRYESDAAIPSKPMGRRGRSAVLLAASRQQWRWIAAWAGSLLVAVWVAMAQAPTGGTGPPPSDRASLLRFSHQLPPEHAFTARSHNVVAMAPDGSAIVYEANGRLFRRGMTELEASPIRGTDGSPASPFFSPDSRTIGYWDSAARELRRIPVAGGTPVTIAPATVPYGASWEANGTILFGQTDGIWRVDAAGGSPEMLVPVEDNELVYGPRMLPDGETMMFSITAIASMTGQITAWDSARVVVQSLVTGERKEILHGGHPRYVPTGHIVYALGRNLYAVSFELTRLEVLGGPVPIIEGIRRAVRGSRGQGGTANYDFSFAGSLVYVPAGPDSAGQQVLLLGVDPAGNTEPLIEERRDYWRPRFSPDGSRVVVEVESEDANQIWIVDLRSGTATPLVVGGENDYPVWTADGEWIVYSSSPGGVTGAYRQRADGTGETELLLENVWPSDASREGVLAFIRRSRSGHNDIVTYDLNDGSVSDFVSTGAIEHMARFSPDGRWLAYTSNESGRDEVYVRPFPRTAGIARLVSVGGGVGPVWAPDGSRLYYRGASGDIMAVPSRLGTTFTAGRPLPLFRYLGAFTMSNTSVSYDIDPDGSRFVMVSGGPHNLFPSHVNLVQNWFEELQRVR